MPIPKPSSNEGRDEFISKCMHFLKNENKFPQKQKVAICEQTYERSKKGKKAQGSVEEPIWEEEYPEIGPFYLAP